MSGFDEARVRQIAELACLDLDDDEVRTFATHLKTILAHVDELVAFEGDAEVSSPSPAPTSPVASEVDPSRLREAAPASADDHFVFPRAVRGTDKS